MKFQCLTAIYCSTNNLTWFFYKVNYVPTWYSRKLIYFYIKLDPKNAKTKYLHLHIMSTKKNIFPVPYNFFFFTLLPLFQGDFGTMSRAKVL